MAKGVRELQRASKKSQSVRDRMHARQKKKNVLSFLGKERRKEQGKNEERSAQQSILHWGRYSREGYLH